MSIHITDVDDYNEAKKNILYMRLREKRLHKARQMIDQRITRDRVMIQRIARHLPDGTDGLRDIICSMRARHYE